MKNLLSLSVLQERDLFLLLTLLRYPMTLNQLFKYISLNYYEKPFPSKNYLQKRLMKLFKTDFIKREKCVINKNLKPSYYYYLSGSDNIIKYIPEILELEEKSRERIISSIEVLKTDDILSLSNFMIYFDNFIYKNNFKYDCFIREGDVLFDIVCEDKKTVITPYGAIIFRDYDSKSYLFLFDFDENNNFFHTKSDANKIDLYNILLTKNRKFLFNNYDLDYVKLVLLIKKSDNIQKYKNYISLHQLENKINIIQIKEEYTKDEIKSIFTTRI